MKKLSLKLLSGLAIVAVLASCASTAYVEKDHSVNFNRYKTYTWIQKDEKEKRNNDIMEGTIHNAVNQELAKAGWKEVDSRPDVLIGYDVLVERNMKQQSSPVYSQPYSRVFYNPYSRRYSTIYYPSQFLGYDDNQRPVREGTITISMIDAKTDKTVWQGWTTDEVNSRNLTSKEIQNSVKSIFKKFDVAKN
jgi:hypothetical protein